MTCGDGLRANSGGKNLNPNRSFSTRTSLPLIVFFRKKSVGYPTPANRNINSSKTIAPTGKTTEAMSRNSHLFPGDIFSWEIFCDRELDVGRVALVLGCFGFDTAV